MNKQGFKRAVAFIMIIVLFSAFAPKTGLFNRKAAAENERWAYVNVCGSKNILKIRQGAGLGYSAVADAKGNPAYVYGHQKVQIISEKKGTDNELWYFISYDFNGKTYKGYIRYDYIIEKNTGYDEAYAAELKAKGFPDSYIEGLCYLHYLYPKWVFTPYFTGGGTSIDTSLDWATSLKKENTFGYSLLPANSCKTEVTKELIYSWFSHEEGAYNPLTDTYTSYDTGNWYQASNEAIAYYMDPRNFLTEKGISMFRSQAYNPAIQTLEGTQEVIKSSFMSGTYDGVHSYASLLMTAAEQSGVSPYVLANKIMQEVGTKGQTNSVSGTMPGYEGLYNYFNVGAAQRDGKSAIENGLIYASKTDESTLRPWNTRERAVIGGSIFFGKMYVSRGQSNHYLQKFNMSATSTYAHQYMGNILDPAHQAAGNFSKNDDFAAEAEFLIPVFKNMPEEPCPLPLGYSSPNSYLKSLTINGISMTPTFNYKTLEYSTTVAANVNIITVSAAAVNSQAKISGTGNQMLSDGNNVISITVTAGDGSQTVYKLTVYKQSASNPPSGESDVGLTYNVSTVYPTVDTYLLGITPTTKVADFMKNIASEGATLTDAQGNAIAADALCVTGYVLNAEGKKYTICVKGDINPDGRVSIKDLLAVKKYLMGAQTLDQAQIYAASVISPGRVTIKDLLAVKHNLLGLSVFSEGV